MVVDSILSGCDKGVVMFELNVNNTEDKTVIEVKDRLDSLTSLAFEEILSDVRPNIPVEVDCKELSYISSAGLRCLLKLKKQVGDVDITMKDVNECVMDVLDISGMTMILNFES